MADLTLTQAQLDAMLASGELSLTAPAPKEQTPAVPAPEQTPAPQSKAPVDVAGLFGGVENPATPSAGSGTEGSGTVEATTSETLTTAVPGIVLPQEDAAPAETTQADIPETEETLLPLPKIGLIPLRPAGRMSKSRKRKYDTAMLGQTKLAAKIEDPRLRAMAGSAVVDGANFNDVAQTIGTLIAADKKLKRRAVIRNKRKAAVQKEQQKQAQLKAKITMTRDTKKVPPKIVNQWGKFAAASEYIEKLMDNYEDSEVGVFDASDSVQWAKRQLGDVWGDQDKRSKRDNAYSGLESSLKSAFGFGANYSAKEQEMMQRYIPSQADSEDAYKKQLVSSLEGIKNELKNSVRAQTLGKRDSQKFNAFLTEIDGRIAKAKAFAGVSDAPEAAPTNLVSIGKSRSGSPDPDNTPAQSEAVHREDLPGGRVKVTFSDGSVKYGRRK